MKSPKVFPKSVWFVLLAGLLLAGIAPAQNSRPLPWGKENNGLRMAIYPSSPPGVRSPGSRFIVAFQNTGRTDLALNLGTSLANGKTQYPDKAVLILTDQAGPHPLTLREPPVKGGGASPFIVRLAPGGTSSFSVNLEDYWLAPSGKFDTRLKPGYYYTIEASFTGQTVAQPVLASATSGAASPPLWTGSVKSKRFRFSIGPGGPGYWPYRRYAPYPPYGPYGYPPPYGYAPPYGYPPPYYGRPYPPPPPPPQSQSQSPYGDDQAAPQQNGGPPPSQPQ